MAHRTVLLAVLLLVTLYYLPMPVASQLQGEVAFIATPTKLLLIVLCYSSHRILECLDLCK